MSARRTRLNLSDTHNSSAPVDEFRHTVEICAHCTFLDLRTLARYGGPRGSIEMPSQLDFKRPLFAHPDARLDCQSQTHVPEGHRTLTLNPCRLDRTFGDLSHVPSVVTSWQVLLGLLRLLIERIVVRPLPDGSFELEIVGAIAAMVGLGQ